MNLHSFKLQAISSKLSPAAPSGNSCFQKSAPWNPMSFNPRSHCSCPRLVHIAAYPNTSS